jgi:hypothetical protein
MRRGIDHAAPAATGAEAAALTREGNQQFVAAAIALNPHEAVLKTPALQVIVKFIKYEFRQITVVLVQVVRELRQMMLDDLIQQRQFRTVTNIGSGRNVGQDGTIVSWAV